MRITGTMKFYNSAKGFGFVQPEDGSKDVFVHATALEAAGIRALNEGDKISFVLEDDRRGPFQRPARIQLRQRKKWALVLEEPRVCDQAKPQPQSLAHCRILRSISRVLA